MQLNPLIWQGKGHTLPSTLSDSLSLCTRGGKKKEKKRAAPINFAFKRQVRPRVERQRRRGRGALPHEGNNSSFLDTLFLTAMNCRVTGSAAYKRAIEHICQGSRVIL